MERRKLGWIKIVKKDREFLMVVEENTGKRGGLVITSKLESEAEVVDVASYV